MPTCVWTYTQSYLNQSNLIGAFCSKYITKSEDDTQYITRNDLKPLFEDKSISREYELHNKKLSKFCTEIEEHLDTTFIERKKIGGKNKYGVITGYKLNHEIHEFIDSEEDN